MECSKFNKNLLKKEINSNFENYYIKWKDAFTIEFILETYKNILNIIDKSIESVDSNDISVNYKIVKKIVNNYPNFFDINIESKNGYYTFCNFLSSGSSGFTFLYQNSDYSYCVLKIPKKGEKFTSKIETIIHYTINIYQELYKKFLKFDYLVPKIINILMSKDGYYYSLMEKYDGDSVELFSNYEPLEKINYSNFSSKSILFNTLDKKYEVTLFIYMLYQISKILILLQDNFTFMHNDLKPSNILFKIDKTGYLNKIKFTITDFGGSSCIINGDKYTGTILCSDSNFSYKKDLFLLVHMFLSFSKDRNELIEYIEKLELFKLDKKIISSKQIIWLKIYRYEMDGNIIDDSFNPRNFVITYNKLFKVF